MLRKNKKILNAAKYFILLFLFFGFSANSQKIKEEFKTVLEFKDTRSAGKNNELIKKLNSENIDISILSAWALSNITDTTLINVLGEALLSSTGKINNDYKTILLPGMLAFALGQYNSAEANNYLIKAFDKVNSADKNSDKSLLIDLINNISIAGGEEDFNHIMRGISNNDKYNSVIAMAIARFGIRKINNEDGLRKLSELFKLSSDSALLKNISYAFFRSGNKKLLEPYKDILLKLIESNDPFTETRMWSYAALGKLQDTAITDKLLYEMDIENDWRVKVNIAIALGSTLPEISSPLTDKIITALTQHAMQDNSAHVSIVCLQSIGKLFAGKDVNSNAAQKIKQSLLQILSPQSNLPWQVKAEALKTYGKIFKDEAKSDLVSFFISTDNYDLKSAAVGAFSFMDDPLVYKELRQMISDDVMKYNELHPNKDGSMIGSNDLAKLYRAFVGTLTELDDKMDKDNRNTIRLILTEFSSSKDAPLTDICLSNLQDSIYLEYRNETCGIMTFDYPGFVLPKDKDIMLMFIEAWGNMKFKEAEELLKKNLTNSDYDIVKASADALFKITGKNYSDKITAPKYRTDFDWEFIDKLGDKKYAELKTNRGIITIELKYKVAPFTVQNFVKLSQKGFYNNTVFHRVVPNFVIQGGDPTGTGYGGPGYSIRSEFSPLPFDEYTVGMASSGKDTEGSQFFITHSPQPHLDGKYTVFGKVIDGKDVVDKIQIGDYIEAITFSAEK